MEHIRSLARAHSTVAINTLSGIAKSGESEAARVSAAIHLLDRGWGKPEQVHSGVVDGDIRITIRQILDVDRADRAKLIEGKSDGDPTE